MNRTIIRNGRVIDPGQDLDQVADILIEEGKIAGIGTDLGEAEQEMLR